MLDNLGHKTHSEYLIFIALHDSHGYANVTILCCTYLAYLFIFSLTDISLYRKACEAEIQFARICCATFMLHGINSQSATFWTRFVSDLHFGDFVILTHNNRRQTVALIASASLTVAGRKGSREQWCSFYIQLSWLFLSKIHSNNTALSCINGALEDRPMARSTLLTQNDKFVHIHLLCGRY